MTDGDPAGSATREAGLTVLVDGAATAGRFALLALTVARGAEPPRHRHHREDEALSVLSGAPRLWVGGAGVATPAGAAVFLPRGVEHGGVVATSVARLLVALTPAGFAGCYRALGGPEAPSLERLVATAARYGCEVTGPPPIDAPSEAAR